MLGLHFSNVIGFLAAVLQTYQPNCGHTADALGIPYSAKCHWGGGGFSYFCESATAHETFMHTRIHKVT